MGCPARPWLWSPSCHPSLSSSSCDCNSAREITITEHIHQLYNGFKLSHVCTKHLWQCLSYSILLTRCSKVTSVHIRVLKSKPVLYRKKSHVLTTSLIIPTLELAVSSNLVEGGDLAKLGVITRGGGSLPFSGNLYISPNYLRFLCSPVVLRMKSIHLYPPPWQP